MSFSDKLAAKIKETGNVSVMGLDPKLEFIPDSILKEAAKDFGTGFEGAAQALLRFNTRLIDAVDGIVPAVKPQLAYYEMYGVPGVKAFYDTVSYAAKKGMLVIADGKRNDIGPTAEAYAQAYLGETALESGKEAAFGADALTVNGYLGVDGIKPFQSACEKGGKGIFVLVKTSNPSSGQLQDLTFTDGRTLYEVMADLVNEWGESTVGQCGYSSIGAVVGATYPAQLEQLRKRMPRAWFLVPGFGAQGGGAEDVAKAFNPDGLGAVVNASRSLMCAYKLDFWKDKYTKESFDQAARAEALRMRDAINSVRNPG